MFWMRLKFLIKSGSKVLTWLPSVQAQLWILGWCQLWLGPGACLIRGTAQQYQFSNPPQKGQSQQGKEKKNFMLALATSKALCQIRPWWPPQHCWPPWSGWQVHSSAHGSTITSNEADSVLPSAAAVFTASVADLFLFKFLPSPEPRGTVPGRKVLRFCGNINSVLLHITCHPGGLWLISTYFSSLGPALIQMASGTPDHRPGIQPNPVSTSEIWVLYLHVIVKMLSDSFPHLFWKYS